MPRSGNCGPFRVMLAVALTGLLVMMTVLAKGASTGASDTSPCAPVVYADNAYTVCTIDPERYVMELYWDDANGTPYRWFGDLPASHQGRPIAFAMNAGMYDTGLGPVGLYIEDGHERRSLNTNQGPGNFHLLPNGVFFMADGRAGVMETERFSRAGLAVDLATQSGPMLVIDGEIHPRFIPGGTSRKRRNGVGVTADGMIVFAISEGLVNFWDFGHLFRDHLGTDNALFLDGTMSSLYAPAIGREDRRRPMGPIIAAYARD